MALQARIDRHKCIGAGNGISLAPTAFDWLAGDYGKTDVVGTATVDEEVLRAAVLACPTAAIWLEDVAELLGDDAVEAVLGLVDLQKDVAGDLLRQPDPGGGGRGRVHVQH